MNSPSPSYGTLRDRSPSVSFADIEAAARKLMTAGEYPSVHAVRLGLKRGSTTTIAEGMRRFWKDQAALNAGNPVALTRLPPEFADAAVALWEQALRLSLQTAKADDSAAHATLEELKRETESRSRSLELREKEWDLAARVRERALTDTRDQVNMLLQELANATAQIKTRDARLADFEIRLEEQRRQLANVIARAVSRNRAGAAVKPSAHSRAKAKGRNAAKGTIVKRKSLGSRKKAHGKRR